jgi:hypothetical protein
MISSTFVIICQFFVIEIEHIPFVLAHCSTFWILDFGFLLQLFNNFVPSLCSRYHLQSWIDEFFLCCMFCMFLSNECQHFIMVPIAMVLPNNQRFSICTPNFSIISIASLTSNLFAWMWTWTYSYLWISHLRFS